MYQLRLLLRYKNTVREDEQVLVPSVLRNVLNPWQTEKEIKSQAKTAGKILSNLSDDKKKEWLGNHIPDKIWEAYPEK